MYLVVSKWEALPGHETEFREKGMAMRRALKGLPEVVLLENIQNDQGQSVVVMGYPDEGTYQSTIHDPAGPFAKLIEKHELEKHSRWLWSEKGEAVAD